MKDDTEDLLSHAGTGKLLCIKFASNKCVTKECVTQVCIDVVQINTHSATDSICKESRLTDDFLKLKIVK